MWRSLAKHALSLFIPWLLRRVDEYLKERKREKARAKADSVRTSGDAIGFLRNRAADRDR
jgi:hypothetical protein